MSKLLYNLKEGQTVQGIILSNHGTILGHITDIDKFHQRYTLGCVMARKKKKYMVCDELAITDGFEKLIGTKDFNQAGGVYYPMPYPKHIFLVSLTGYANRGVIKISKTFNVVWMEDYD